MKGERVPNFEFHLPQTLSYPLRMGIISLTLAVLLYYILQASRPGLASVLAGVCLLAGGVYVGISAVLKRITYLERRHEAQDRLLEGTSMRGENNESN